MRVIDDKGQTQREQDRLADRLRRGVNRGFQKLGFQGGSLRVEIYYFPEHHLWWGHRSPKSRHWNAFGVWDGNAWTGNGEHIICEANPRIKPVSTAGAFAEKDGRTYLIHTGRLNGKTRDGANCTIEALRECTRELDWKRIDWYNGKQKEVIVVSSLDDLQLISNISMFVNAVYRFKNGPTPLDIQEKEQQDVRRYAEEKSRSEIKKILQGNPRAARRGEFVVRRFERDNRMTALIKEYRGRKCQICNVNIREKNGGRFVEAAHIKPKKDGGDETLENILVLCPNHHAEFDKGDKEIIDWTKDRIIFRLNEILYNLSLK